MITNILKIMKYYNFFVSINLNIYSIFKIEMNLKVIKNIK